MSMIKPEFTLLQVQVKGLWMDASEFAYMNYFERNCFSQSGFGNLTAGRKAATEYPERLLSGLLRAP